MTEPAARRFAVSDVAMLAVEAVRAACVVLDAYQRLQPSD